MHRKSIFCRRIRTIILEGKIKIGYRDETVFHPETEFINSYLKNYQPFGRASTPIFPLQNGYDLLDFAIAERQKNYKLSGRLREYTTCQLL